MHQHRDGHRPDAAGHRRDCAAFGRHFGKGDVADEFRAFWRSRIGHAIDAHIDHHRAFFDHVRFDKFRLANRRDQNIRTTADFREIPRAGMRDRHRRIAAAAFIHQEKCHRLSHDHRASEDYDICTGSLDAALYEQTLAAERRARDKCVRIAHGDFRDIDGMKSVHVLSRIDRIDHCTLVDVLRRRRLHEDAVDRRVRVQRPDDGEQFVLRRRRRHVAFYRMHPEVQRRLFLALHVSMRSRIIAHHDHCETGCNSARLQFRDRSACLFVDSLGDCFSINECHPRMKPDFPHTKQARLDCRTARVR